MSNNATYFTPLAVVSATDRGGALLIVNIIGLITSLVAVALRVFISNRGSGKGFAFFKDDLFCSFATLLSIVVFALIWTGVAKGNGKATHLISPHNLSVVQQIQYATDILYILSLYCSRTSVLFLLERLQCAPSNLVWRICLGILSAWALASVLMTALTCDLSHPWIQYNVQCSGLLPRWQAIEISGIIIEAALFALVIYVVWGLRMPLAPRVKVVILFGTRIFVIVFAALRLAYLPSSFSSAYASIPTTIYALAEMHASIVTSTTPLLKGFIQKFKVVSEKPTVLITSRRNQSRRSAPAIKINRARGARHVDSIEDGTVDGGNSAVRRDSFAAPNDPDAITHASSTTEKRTSSPGPSKSSRCTSGGGASTLGVGASAAASPPSNPSPFGGEVRPDKDPGTWRCDYAAAQTEITTGAGEKGRVVAREDGIEVVRSYRVLHTGV